MLALAGFDFTPVCLFPGDMQKVVSYNLDEKGKNKSKYFVHNIVITLRKVFKFTGFFFSSFKLYPLQTAS